MQWKRILPGPLEDSPERTGRNIDQHGFIAGSLVIESEALPEFGNAQTHGGVAVGVVIGPLVEEMSPDITFLQQVGTPSKCLRNDELKQLLHLLGGAEGRALQDGGKRFLNLSRIGATRLLVLVRRGRGCICSTNQEEPRGLRSADGIDWSSTVLYPRPKALTSKILAFLYLNRTRLNLAFHSCAKVCLQLHMASQVGAF